MTNKTFLDKLFYEFDKQRGNLELAYAYLDSEGNPKFSKWKKYLEAQSDDKFILKVNNRTILPNEVVLDIEEPERFSEVLKKVEEEFEFYSAYKTGSKGYHIHLLFAQDLTQEEKLYVIKEYGCDEQKASVRCMIALENVPHWKTGNIKTLIEEKKGFNDVSKVKGLLGNLSKDILNGVKLIIKKYIDTNEDNISILALWLIGTYFHNKFETFPLLYLNAQKRSGKTRTLKLLSSLADKSDGSVNTSPTETYLFRHKEGALFFDEMENISSKERGAFRETLNAVYKKGNKIIRYREKKNLEGNDYVEVCFYPYYPLALANISGVGDVLSDRAIQIVLQRSNKINTKLVEDFTTNKKILSLKEKLKTLDASIPEGFFSEWNNYIQELNVENTSLLPFFEKVAKTEIYGRALEIFFPLFIIAYLCGSLEDFLAVAKNYIFKREEEEKAEDFDEILKEFLYRKAEEHNEEFVSLIDLLNAFKQELENPEDWINSKWLGRAIKRLDLISKKRRINGKVQVILKKNAINTTNTINSINTTNATNKVELVDNVAFGDINKIDFSELDKEFKDG